MERGGTPDSWTGKPPPKGEGFLPWRLLEAMGGVGLVLARRHALVLWWSYNGTGDLDTRPEPWPLTQMVVFQFFHVLQLPIRLDRSISESTPFSNRFLF